MAQQRVHVAYVIVRAAAEYLHHRRHVDVKAEYGSKDLPTKVKVSLS